MEFFKYLIYCTISFFSTATGGAPDSSIIDDFVGFVCILVLGGILILLIRLSEFIYKKVNKNKKPAPVKKRNDYIQDPIEINSKPLNRGIRTDKK